MKNNLLLVLFLFPLISFAQTPEVGSFTHDGIERDYLVRLPTGFTPGESLPLVFNFHGIGSTSGEQFIYTGLLGGMNIVADTGNFIVCYPDGTRIPNDEGFEWNVGYRFSSTTADDVGFVDELIDTLHAKYQIDLNRVYATGMSNGGYLAYRLACELPHRIQAVASVTGSIVPEELMNCQPSRAVPVLQVHGTADPVVPINGFDHGLPIADVIQFWLDNNNCMSGTSTVVEFDDINQSDGSTVKKTTYADCSGTSQVLYYEVEGGEHTWPGSSLTDIGITNQDIVASREIWEFFLQYTAPIPVSTRDLGTATFNLQIQPNPFTDQVLVEVEEETLQSLVVTDLLGRTIYQNDKVQALQQAIPTSDWNSGIYLLRAETPSGAVSVHKIIKD